MMKIMATLAGATVLVLIVACETEQEINLAPNPQAQEQLRGWLPSGWSFEDREHSLFVHIENPEERDARVLVSKPGTVATWVTLIRLDAIEFLEEHTIEALINGVGPDDVFEYQQLIVVKDIRWNEDQGDAAIYSGNFLERVTEEVTLVYDDAGWQYGQDR